jgi:DNA polymerase-3 subunit epsilon
VSTLLNRILGRKSAELPDWLAAQLESCKSINLKQGIGEVEYVAFDTELTGLDFKRDSIISIGAVKLKGTTIRPTRTFYRLVKPECELKGDSVVVHELTHSDLECAEDLLDVVADFIRFAGNAVFIGHFVHIDLNFVNKVLQKNFGVSLNNPAVDTATLHDWLYDNDARFARHYQGMTTKSDLFTMAKKYGVEIDKSHNAFSDAYITAQLFQRFTSFLPECGIRSIKDLLKIARP